MNINKDLFESSQKGLFATMDTVRPLCETHKKEFEYYAAEYCTKVMIDYYKAKENSEKNPAKLLTAVFNAGLITRFIFDNFARDVEERNREIINFLSDFKLWREDGWMENNLINIAECDKYNNYLELTISDSQFLTYQKSVIIDDNGNLKDMLSILYSVFLFSCCIKLQFKKV